ncbi:cation:proton antiporter [Caulobacter segnis]
MLLLQDLAVIPMFALLPLLATGAAAGHAEAGGPGWRPLQALVALPGSGPRPCRCSRLLAGVIGGGRCLVRPVFRFIAKARLREIFVAAALLIVVAVASLMQIVGLSRPPSKACLAGVVLAESEFRRELESDIEPFRGLLAGPLLHHRRRGREPCRWWPAQPLVLARDRRGSDGPEVPGHVRHRPPVRAPRSAKSAPWPVATALAQGGEFAASCCSASRSGPA